MSTIIAHVDFPEGASNPTVNPSLIDASGEGENVVIRWYASERVLFFTIGGSLPSNQFNPTESSPNVISFSTTDINTDGQQHDYMVTATSTSGQTGTVDPKIQNGVGT